MKVQIFKSHEFHAPASSLGSPYHVTATEELVKTLVSTEKGQPSLRVYAIALRENPIKSISLEQWPSIDDSPELLQEKMKCWEEHNDHLRLTTAGLKQQDFLTQNARKLKGADLQKADLEAINLPDADLSYADLTEAKLARANLVNADFSGAKLIGADLTEAQLTRASLVYAKLNAAILRSANLREATLSEAKLQKADLSGANLSGGTLAKADLTGANLSGTNLSDATLLFADLSMADLSDAKIQGADFYKVNLTGTKLSLSQARSVNELKKFTGEAPDLLEWLDCLYQFKIEEKMSNLLAYLDQILPHRIGSKVHFNRPRASKPRHAHRHTIERLANKQFQVTTDDNELKSPNKFHIKAKFLFSMKYSQPIVKILSCSITDPQGSPVQESERAYKKKCIEDFFKDLYYVAQQGSTYPGLGNNIDVRDHKGKRKSLTCPARTPSRASDEKVREWAESLGAILID